MEQSNGEQTSTPVVGTVEEALALLQSGVKQVLLRVEGQREVIGRRVGPRYYFMKT
jgi:hypothetical protein